MTCTQHESAPKALPFPRRYNVADMLLTACCYAKKGKNRREQALPNHLHSTLEAMWYSFDSLLSAGWDQGAFQGETDHTIR